jgi:hypothetical protein
MNPQGHAPRIRHGGLAPASLLALAFWSGVVLAQPADPTSSASCREALARLEAREADAAAGRKGTTPDDRAARPAPDADLEAARRAASVACLGGPGDPPGRRQRFGEPPVSVPPVMPPPVDRRVAPPGAPGTERRDAPPGPAAQAPPPRPPVASRAVPPRGPTSITSCDALGCWASDGSRLNRMGPDLVGERGVCRAHGKLLRCP